MTMTPAFKGLKNNRYFKTLVVANDDVNENGVMDNCSILREVTSINDNAMIEAFGKLNFDGISVSRYSINFHDDALTGDELKIESTYSFYENKNLTILIDIRKDSGAKNVPVLTGSFTFINNTNHL